MNDFKPTVQPTPDMQAASEFAKIAGDQRLVTLIQRSAQLHQFQQFKVIENQEQYNQAIDAFDAAKKTIKELEDLRHSVVDYPTKFIRMVNDLFKQIRDGVEGSKKHLGDIITVKREKDEEEARKAREEREETKVVEEDGVAVVDMGDEPPPPSNVVESARGAKVHSRSDLEVTIVDLKEFLKALTSKNKRYEWFTDEAENLVEVKMGALKNLIKANGRKGIPGVTSKKITRTV